MHATPAGDGTSESWLSSPAELRSCVEECVPCMCPASCSQPSSQQVLTWGPRTLMHSSKGTAVKKRYQPTSRRRAEKPRSSWRTFRSSIPVAPPRLPSASADARSPRWKEIGTHISAPREPACIERAAQRQLLLHTEPMALVGPTSPLSEGMA